MSHHYDIRVEVDATYIPEKSDPESQRFVFAYTITIRNVGEIGAKLLNRHWTITDANGKVEQVDGEGVVGEQPHLMPGESFRYTSGAILETPVGAMEGHYDMQADDGHAFDAPIPPFSLAQPGHLH